VVVIVVALSKFNVVNKSGSLSSMQFSMWERLNIHALHYFEIQVLYDWIVSKHPQILTMH
jgi:hypothetical protein